MRAMVEGAGRVVSVTTASKLGSAGPYPVAAIERIDTLVSDAPDEELQVYRDLGIEVRARMTGTPKQARGAVTAIFFLNGLIFGAWAARIPAVRDRVGLSDGELGVVLTFTPYRLDLLAMPDHRQARRAHRAAPAPRAPPSRSCASRPPSSRFTPRLPVCSLLAFFSTALGSLDVAIETRTPPFAVEHRCGSAILAQLPHCVLDRRGLADAPGGTSLRADHQPLTSVRSSPSSPTLRPRSA